MKSFFRNLNSNRLELALSLFTLLIVFSPYMQPDLITGSDCPFHLARIETLAQNLRYGIFPTKVHVDLCYGYGYGVGFFYPNFFLYIPAILRLLGLSLEVSFKLFAGMIQTGIFLSLFFCVYNLVQDRIAALSCAIIFLFSNIVLDSFYFNFTLGTSLGLIFLPLAICGMYLFLVENHKPYMLGFGFTGLILSHVLSTALALAICILLLLVHVRKLFSFPRKIFTLVLTALAVSGFTACFWLPMFEQFLAQQYRVSQPWTWVDDNILYLGELFRANGPGWALLFVALFLSFQILITSQNNEFSIEQNMHKFLLLGLVFLLLPLCKPFWRLFRNAFKFVQFPKRLFAPASILLLFAFGIWLAIRPLSERRKKYGLFFIFLFSLYTGTNYLESHIAPLEDFGNRIIYQEIAGIGSGEEWLPLETTREHLSNALIAIPNEKEHFVFGTKSEQFFTFQPDETMEYYDVPFVWYKGYIALDESNVLLPIGKNPQTGMVRVYTANRENNSPISVWYQGTHLQNISYIISASSILAFLCISLFKKLLKH